MCSHGWEPLSPRGRSNVTNETPGHHPRTNTGGECFLCIWKALFATWRNMICVNSRLLSCWRRDRAVRHKYSQGSRIKLSLLQSKKLQTSTPRRLAQKAATMNQLSRAPSLIGKRNKRLKIFQDSKETWFFMSWLLKKKKKAHILLLCNLRCLKGCGKCHNAFHQYHYRHLIKISSDSIYALGKGIQLWRLWRQKLLNAKILLLIVLWWKNHLWHITSWFKN